MAFKDNSSPVLTTVLSSLSIIKDQAPKVKRAQRRLSNHEALLAKKNSNRQEAKELTQLINDIKNSNLRIDPELTQLEARHAELEKELENVKICLDQPKKTSNKS